MTVLKLRPVRKKKKTNQPQYLHLYFFCRCLFILNTFFSFISAMPLLWPQPPCQLHRWHLCPVHLLRLIFLLGPFGRSLEQLLRLLYEIALSFLAFGNHGNCYEGLFVPKSHLKCVKGVRAVQSTLFLRENEDLRIKSQAGLWSLELQVCVRQVYY